MPENIKLHIVKETHKIKLVTEITKIISVSFNNISLIHNNLHQKLISIKSELLHHSYSFAFVELLYYFFNLDN